MRIKDKSSRYADYNLVVGENNIDLTTLPEGSTCDFTNIDDITFWGSESAVEGYTIDNEHPASVVITNAYMFSPTMTIKTATGFGEEITDLSYLTGGGRFVIAKADGTSFQSYIANEAGATAKKLSEYSDDLYYFFTIEALPALDVDGDGNEDATTYYRIAIQNEAGSAKPNNWWGANYINVIDGWNAIWSAWCDVEHDKIYGRDGKFFGIWTVEYVQNQGFKFYNPGKGMYLTVNGRESAETYLKLYKNLVISSKTVVDVEKFDNAANDQIFAFSKASGYNAETGEMTNVEWVFNTPVDISSWDYLMITTVNNPTSTGGAVTIADDNGNSVGGEAYSGSTAGTGGNMWLDRWNNQNAIRISIDYLRINKELDVTKIKSLKINGTTKLANVYLTDYNNTKISGGYKDGDVVRTYSETGKFGTICLPYVASYAGAEIYSIASASASGIALTKVIGLLEAGKPYFYVSSDENGKDNAGAVRNVNFFRADLATYDVTAPVANNGLVGTFEDMPAPTGDNYYVLYSNELYNVDSEVTVGANKAYINVSEITNSSSSAKSRVSIDFEGGQATGIAAIENNDAVNAITNAAIYNLNGQRVMNPTRGIYIVNGKKLFIK